MYREDCYRLHCKHVSTSKYIGLVVVAIYFLLIEVSNGEFCLSDLTLALSLRYYHDYFKFKMKGSLFVFIFSFFRMISFD